MGSPHILARIRRVQPAGVRGVTIETDLRLPAQAGQFVMVWLPRVDEKPFSLLDDDPVSLMVLRAGPCTERMQHLQAGEPLYLRGPYGRGFSHGGERPLLVGGGCGAAPLAFLAQRLAERGRAATVALGARTAGELVLRERFLAQRACILVTTDDGTAGEKGLVTELVERRLAAGEHDRVYACGPAPMLEAVARLCRQYNLPGELSWEAYMRCGTGICGSCDRGTGLLVCKDGPVFPVG